MNDENDDITEGLESEPCELEVIDLKKVKDAYAYLIWGLLSAGESGNLVMGAATKSGKTSLWLDAAVAATRGEPVWGKLSVPRPLRVAIVDQEDGPYQLKSSLNKMIPVIGKPNWSNLLVLAGKGTPFSISDRQSLRYLYKRLKEFRPDMVVLDGWGWFVDNDPSEPKLVNTAIRWLSRLRRALGCATVVTHHFKKESEGQHPDPLDKIAGLRILYDQAKTAVTYTPVQGYGAIGLLEGRCDRTEWGPVRLVIDYARETVTHRVVDREEGLDLFDRHTFRRLYGETEEARWLRSVINRVLRVNRWNQSELSEYLGVNRSMVSRYRKGKNEPSKDVMGRIRLLDDEARALEALGRDADGRLRGSGLMPRSTPVDQKSTKLPRNKTQVPNSICAKKGRV